MTQTCDAPASAANGAGAENEPNKKIIPPEVAGATLVPLPRGKKGPPPSGTFGAGVSLHLDADARAKLLQGAAVGCNYAFLCGERVQRADGSHKNIIVIDVDCKPERIIDGEKIAAQHGPETLANLERELGQLPATLESVTPSGGRHLYLRAPPAFACSNKVLGKGAGVEIQNEGQYVVFPGSTLIEGICGPKDIPGTYTWLDAEAPIADLPAAWVAYLSRGAKPAEPASTSNGSAAGPTRPPNMADDMWQILSAPGKKTFDYSKYFPRRVNDASEFLAKVEPCIEGQGGSAQMMHVCASLTCRYELPDDTCFELLKSYNARCEPPWSDEEIQHKLDDARKGESGIERQDYALLDGMMRRSRMSRSNDNGHARPDNAFSVELDADEPLSEMRYQLGGLLVAGTVNAFVATGGSLKTWTALSIGLAIQAGKPWLGSFPVEQGNVLLIDYESGSYEVRRRIKLLEKSDGRPKIRYSAHPGSLHDEKTWEALENGIEEHDIRFVIIDSLAGGSGGEDENAATFAAPLKHAALVSDRTGAGFLFIHHANKSGGEGANMVRGSSAIHAACDAVYRFTPPAESGAEKRTEMHVLKPGPGEVPRAVKLVFSTAGGLRLDVAPPAAVARVLTDEEIKTKLLATLGAHPEGIAATALCREVCLPESQGRRVKAALKELTENGRVTEKRLGSARLKILASERLTNEEALSVIDRVHAESDLLNAGVDKEHLRVLLSQKRIYKSGRAWHVDNSPKPERSSP